jgi:hypothetical protein
MAPFDEKLCHGLLYRAVIEATMVAKKVRLALFPTIVSVYESHKQYTLQNI